jgi:hypothetical protein
VFWRSSHSAADTIIDLAKGRARNPDGRGCSNGYCVQPAGMAFGELGHELGSGRAVCSSRLASLRLVPFLSFLSFHSLISQPPHSFEVIGSCLARLPP